MVCDLVSIAQFEFIPGRQIVDYVLATNLIKGYTWSHISPRCMLKIDMAKAYDSIEWSVLKNVLSEVGFPC